MRHLLWFVMAFVLFALPFAAEAQFPKPKPATPEVVTQAPPSTPVVVAPSPAPAPAPQPAAPWTMSDVLSLIWTGLGTAAAGLFGKQVLWPKAPVASEPPSLLPTTMTDFLSRIKEPEIRRQMDEYALKVVQTGVPGAALQSGLSLVPGVGPLAAQLEPMLRKIVIDVLEKRAAGTPS